MRSDNHIEQNDTVFYIVRQKKFKIIYLYFSKKMYDLNFQIILYVEKDYTDSLVLSRMLNGEEETWPVLAPCKTSRSPWSRIQIMKWCTFIGVVTRQQIE